MKYLLIFLLCFSLFSCVRKDQTPDFETKFKLGETVCFKATTQKGIITEQPYKCSCGQDLVSYKVSYFDSHGKNIL